MASGLPTSWQIEGIKVEAVTDFIFFSSKITVDSDCSHEVKMPAPWKKSYDKPRQCIKNQRHPFANKGPCSQSYGFPVAMYRCKIWTIKKVECWRTDAFQLWFWEDSWSLLGSKEIKLVHSKGNQPWIFIGRTDAVDAEADTPILWPPDLKIWLIGKDPELGKIEGRRGKGWQRMRWLNGITDSMNMNLSKLQETVKNRGVWHAAVYRVAKSQTWSKKLNNNQGFLKRWYSLLFEEEVNILWEKAYEKTTGIFPLLIKNKLSL